MTNNEKSILVLSAFPTSISVKDIAEILVNEKLAACINIIPEVQSVFRWKNKVDNTPENILIIKTTLNLYDILEKRIKQLHPYELPEIIAVPIERGLTEYLNWVNENTK